ncbi:hypothetical protein OBP_178 [Pseudomonas phage OBP]|uniref:hypothetical protein n=1 Tax=Pseudomonas phage OBP TaxID=1124849 RepID=UPI000240D592|nr:hypothetical protein OBP_178 [Pseudomonas phage OBP]AEV89615.1 hypothetical protein OBP_178 [Pseudomonas phage OBP]
MQSELLILILSQVTLTGIVLILAVLEVAKMYHRMFYAGEDARKAKSAVDNCKHQLWTIMGIYMVLTVVQFYKSGIPIF